MRCTLFGKENAMAEFKFNNGILNIKVNQYGESILIDSTDLNIFEKFSNLCRKADEYANEANKTLDEFNEKYKEESEPSVDMILDYVGINVTYSKNIMEELKNIFGSDFTDKVYRENYELNQNFVPDEISLTELIEALIPVMEDAYGERIKRNKSKYNANKRGKHNKTRAELLEELKEKSGARG